MAASLVIGVDGDETRLRFARQMGASPTTPSQPASAIIAW